jgi:hypothetical protein
MRVILPNTILLALRAEPHVFGVKDPAEAQLIVA